MRRARDIGGYERDVALLLVKSALAAVISWLLAQYVIASPQPTYAPFVALLVVQFTIYRSLLHTAQYVGAVCVGVLAAGAASPVLGENVGGFAAMLVVGLLVSRWRQLGAMGIQAPIAGVFAYEALMGDTRISMLWQIVAMVLMGATVGLAVNLLLLPPMRYGTAAHGVQQLTMAVAQLLDDMATGLRDRSQADPEDWLYRARKLDGVVAKARIAVERGAESVCFNPRRLFQKQLRPGFSGYRTLVESLARAVEQVRSVALSLKYQLEAGSSEDEEFLRRYPEALALAADGVRYAGTTDRESQNRLQRSVEACMNHCAELEKHVGNATSWPSLGTLLTDVCRLAEELRRAHEAGAVRAD